LLAIVVLGPECALLPARTLTARAILAIRDADG